MYPPLEQLKISKSVLHSCVVKWEFVFQILDPSYNMDPDLRGGGGGGGCGLEGKKPVILEGNRPVL